MSEEFIKVTDGHTDRQTDTQKEPLPELLSELKKIIAIVSLTMSLQCIFGHFLEAPKAMYF